MTVKIGDVVAFTFDQNRIDAINKRTPGAMDCFGQSSTVPATVVAVWNDECVNLKVHVDGPGGDLWETSINRFDPNVTGGAHWQPLDQ